MDKAFTDAVTHALLRLQVGSSDEKDGNGISVKGFALRTSADGLVEVHIASVQATSLQLSFAPLTPSDNPAAARAAASGEPVPTPFIFAPLATANGTIRAQIVDAHLFFDADVTVSIREGKIDFNDATVEHVGPDSRLGVSAQGVYVDAANGRSYLYQLPPEPVAGVKFERPGLLPGPWGTDRGSIEVQPFAQALMQQLAAGKTPDFTDDARRLFERTSLQGELRLGDGSMVAPGLQATMTGRADGSNAVRLHSQSIGRGVTAELASLAMKDVVLGADDAVRMQCDSVTGSLKLEVLVENGQPRIACTLDNVKLTGVRLLRNR